MKKLLHVLDMSNHHSGLNKNKVGLHLDNSIWKALRINQIISQITILSFNCKGRCACKIN